MQDYLNRVEVSIHLSYELTTSHASNLQQQLSLFFKQFELTEDFCKAESRHDSRFRKAVSVPAIEGSMC